MAGSVFRNDQVDFTFAAEAALGAYAEANVADVEGSSPLTTTLLVAALAGTRVISCASTVALAAVGDILAIGTEGTDNVELRIVVAVDTGTNKITLNAPLGFNHAGSDAVLEQEATAGLLTGLATDVNTGDMIRFTPGIWETIEVPDPVMDIEGRYFLGPESKRNFYKAYEGQQSFTGTLPNMELINGYPLRFPIGKVTTSGEDDADGGTPGESTLAFAATKGDYVINLVDGSDYVAGEYIQIGGTGSGTEEVRKIKTVATNKITLDYPVMITHNSGVACNEVKAPFTHTISETVELDSMTWQIKNRDSGEVVANDWLRRYIGGKIGQATITAEEGGTLRMNWESAPFIDMLHNQYDNSNSSSIVPKFSDSLQPVTVEYPSSKPYFFSQGAITMFGVEFARIASFTLNINNNIEPRYFIRNDGSERTPSAIFEGRREYSLTATIVLPDSVDDEAATRTLFKELLQEGEYDGDKTGFDIELVFTRDAGDTITFTLPPSSATAGGNAQGAFIRSANTSVSTDNPASAEVDILFRSMEIVCVDSEPVYP